MTEMPDPTAAKPLVMVVDDDQAVADVLAARLGRHFRLVSTTDPRRAVELAAQRRPDVILCDIDMAGMNGDEVVFALSEDDRTQAIPVIYLTQLLSDGEPDGLGETFGDCPVLPKTASTQELVDAIAAVLR